MDARLAEQQAESKAQDQASQQEKQLDQDEQRNEYIQKLVQTDQIQTQSDSTFSKPLKSGDHLYYVTQDQDPYILTGGRVFVHAWQTERANQRKQNFSYDELISWTTFMKNHLDLVGRKGGDDTTELDQEIELFTQDDLWMRTTLELQVLLDKQTILQEEKQKGVISEIQYSESTIDSQIKDKRHQLATVEEQLFQRYEAIYSPQKRLHIEPELLNTLLPQIEALFAQEGEVDITAVRAMLLSLHLDEAAVDSFLKSPATLSFRDRLGFFLLGQTDLREQSPLGENQKKLISLITEDLKRVAEKVMTQKGILPTDTIDIAVDKFTEGMLPSQKAWMEQRVKILAAGSFIAGNSDIKALLDFIISGQTYGGHMEGRDELMKKGLPTVGKEHIVKVADSPEQAFSVVEHSLKNLCEDFSDASDEEGNKIFSLMATHKDQQKFMKKKEGSEEEEFDFTLYKEWVMNTFLYLIRNDGYKEKIEKSVAISLFDAGLREVTQQKNDGSQSEVRFDTAEQAGREMKLSLEAIELLLQRANAWNGVQKE
ncbi:MAG: hypothetical protein UX04_C0002G0028 [Microgenomates group bacterium GW2011_GWF2_45_18]|nr:MAG: hypothetical protein UW18_C0001G0069 [Microgenomates group bacterium GW2011_GWF1_44_10]KKU01885.1 MAG: hypothetical protein UX04_C0002G0028 [Microgenomates group bacterium GW2011_GWF2_45_18]